jgi:hypothetical protein
MDEQIELFLHNAELSYRIAESTERKTIFRLGFALDAGNYDLLIFNFHESQLLIGKIFSNSNIPDNKKAVAAEYFMRLNDNLNYGNFELDFSNGNYSFKTSNYYTENSTDLEINLDRSLKACCKAMDDCHHELMNVVYCNISPEQAFNNLMQIPNPILN